VTRAELQAAVIEMSDLLPFNRLLGLRVERFDTAGVEVGFDMRPELIGNVAKQILHGGVISATLDFAGGLTALGTILAEADFDSLDDIGRLFAGFGTIDLRVDYLRPAAGERFAATGVALRVGRRVAVTRMEMHDDHGRLLAAGTGTYITG
jgi:uncharacterized protein (TIGR00369 family)